MDFSDIIASALVFASVCLNAYLLSQNAWLTLMVISGDPRADAYVLNKMSLKSQSRSKVRDFLTRKKPPTPPETTMPTNVVHEEEIRSIIDE